MFSYRLYQPKLATNNKVEIHVSGQLGMYLLVHISLLEIVMLQLCTAIWRQFYTSPELETKIDLYLSLVLDLVMIFHLMK